MIIPHKKLSRQALNGIIEEFVTRAGTDSGYTKTSLEENIERVKRQLDNGEAFIVYDEATQSPNLIHKNHLPKKQ
jgi:hypothetical protein